MRTTTFLILTLLVISGCATRTDGGARVRPLSGQSDSSNTLPSGIPLNDGSSHQTANIYNNNPQQAASGVIHFPEYSGQPASVANVNASNTYVPDNSAFPAYGSAPVQQSAQQPAQTTQQATYTPMIPGQNTAAVTPKAPATEYQPSQNQTGAVQSLLDEANSAVKANQLEKAATALNRAVRLEPNNSSIWYDLAQIRLHQGKYDQSEQLAKKSIDFAKGNQDLVNKNWRVIFSARKARGDLAGADEALRNTQ